MKIGSIITGACLLILAFTAGCDNYERKESVTPDITVNAHELSLFVGETIQLTASPSGLSFTWTSEDNEVATVSANGLVTATGDGNTNIVIISGDMTRRLPITCVTRVYLTDFRLTNDNVTIVLTLNDKYALGAILEPANANDAALPRWSSKDTDVAIVDYKGEVVATGYGTTEIECTINGIVKTSNVSVRRTKPFRGPHILSAAAPYTLKSVDFDFGGRGNAWYDTNTGANQAGTTGTTYRTNNGDNNSGSVSIQSDMASIGYTAANEWLIYTIEVQDAGNYLVSADVAVNGASRYRIDVLDDPDAQMQDDWSNWVNATGGISLTSTGGWSNWAWVDASEPITLTEGTKKIRFFFEQAAFNFRNLKFTYQP